MTMNKQTLFFLYCGLLLPIPAVAYVGPGAGLSLLGALWALVVAVAAAITFLLAWPIRRMRRRRREAKSALKEKRAVDDVEKESKPEERPADADTNATHPRGVRPEHATEPRRQ